jgi:hypothetical protein
LTITAPTAGFGLVAPNPFRASARAIRIQSSSLWDSEFIGIEDSVVAVARWRLAFGVLVARFVFPEREKGLSPGFQRLIHRI